ncbi:nucleotide pyrophosphohydrolase [Loigolactobacillus jiayinensis]|uniref:Nucleotide pyrophosphohydrolase n=1 Tax=Loigolactobacillus jiayinensis TaxID=2486016 RepID=A0ABW1RGR0_9LACO|nr:nucleotide pyrophosphohydrolase [Loigolactobacillus jiayinensis]
MATKYEQVIKDLIEFRDQRGWQKYHNLKDLAISLNLEASEVLEIFQWQPADTELDEQQTQHVQEEIADTLIYCFYMCEKLGVDPLALVAKKVEINQGRHWQTEK